MSQIGAISVKISGDSSGFTKAANQAQKDAGKTSASLKATVAKFAAFAAAGAAAFKIIKKTSDQFSILDNLGKTSDALGVAQKRLQALQHVAELTGAGSDQLATNLERMQRNIGRVAREGGPAEKALKEIGISAKDIVNLPADKQLERIAQSMGNVENSAVKASIAQDLFGRDGVRMLKMMEQLKEDGLDPVVAELEAMGVALSRADTAKIEAANDAIFKAGRASEAIFQQLAVKFAPIVESAANALVQLSKDANRVGETVDGVFSFAVKAVGVFADGLRGIQIIIKGLTAGFQGFAIAVNKIFGAVSKAVDWLINGSINSINKLIGGLNTIPGVGIDAIGEFVNPATKMFESGADAWSAALEGTLKAMHDLATAPLPSEEIESFVARVQQAAQEAADAVESAAGDGAGGGFLGGLTEAEIAALDKRIEAIRQAGLTQSELLQERYELDLEALTEALENELLTREQFDQMALDTAQRHADALTEIDRQGVEARMRLEEMERRQKIQGMQTMFGNLAQLMNAGSRKLFEIGKASAISGAIVSAYEGISKTLAQYPYPLNIGMAAAHGVAAFAQVKAIKSQSFGKGVGGAVNFQGGQPSMNVNGGGGVGPQGPSRNISISLTGSSFGAGGIRELIGQINEAVGDGVSLNVSGG